MLLDFQHSLERDQRILGRFWIDFDMVDHFAFEQVFNAPAKVSQIDSIHRRAHANNRAKEVNLLLGVLFL